MSDLNCSQRFEEKILPHLSSAYNLARHLTRNDQDAEDVVQEAYLRAFRFYGRFQGGDARPWVLTIVRNVFYTWWRQKPAQQGKDFDPELIGSNPQVANPEEALLQSINRELLQRALNALPVQSREVLVLREIEGMSYQEISIVVGAQPATITSRLSRARARLRQSIMDLTVASSGVKA